MRGASLAHGETLLKCVHEITTPLSPSINKRRCASACTHGCTGHNDRYGTSARPHFADCMLYSVLGVPVAFTETTEGHLSVPVITMFLHESSQILWSVFAARAPAIAEWFLRSRRYVLIDNFMKYSSANKCSSLTTANRSSCCCCDFPLKPKISIKLLATRSHVS